MEVDLIAEAEEEASLRDSELPSEVAAWFEARYGEDRVRHVQYADLHGPGHFGDVWIIGSDRALTSIRDDDGELRLSARVPLAEVESLELRQFVGNGRLDALTATSRHTLARFTRSLVREVESGARTFVNLTNQVRAKQSLPLVELTGDVGQQTAARCAICGRVVDREGVCVKVPQSKADRLADAGVRAALPMASDRGVRAGGLGHPHRSPADPGHRSRLRRPNHREVEPGSPAAGHPHAGRHLPRPLRAYLLPLLPPGLARATCGGQRPLADLSPFASIGRRLLRAPPNRSTHVPHDPRHRSHPRLRG